MCIGVGGKSGSNKAFLLLIASKLLVNARSNVVLLDKILLAWTIALIFSTFSSNTFIWFLPTSVLKSNFAIATIWLWSFVVACFTSRDL